MKNRIAVSFAYIIILFITVWQGENIMNLNQKGEYAKTMEKYMYQLGYTQTYSPVYPQNNAGILPTVTESDTLQTAYLPFDDGPTPRTAEILDILKDNNVKATFFVIKAKDEYTQYMQRAVAEGHVIGVHSATHKYNQIYKSVDSYLEDFTYCYDYITNRTGYTPTIFRFPGGSVNNYNANSRRDIVAEMSRRGFVYFDWNVESGDSANKVSSDIIYNNVINGCKGKKRAVIIMHDAINKQTTVQALKNIIPALKQDGWTFATLTNEVKPMIFKMK